jgi:hypothetical protein
LIKCGRAVLILVWLFTEAASSVAWIKMHACLPVRRTPLEQAGQAGIHNNPVEAGIVDKPEEYVYSSARDYYYQKNCGLLNVAFI